MGLLGLSTRGLLFAGAPCVAGVAGEATCAGRRSQALMRSLKQPSWAAPTAVWYLIGFAYYAACFVSLYRLVAITPPCRARAVALALLTAVLAANALWNFIFFRRQNRKLSFWCLAPYAVLVLALVFTLAHADVPSALIFIAYSLYLPYAFAWTYQVWKLNG